MKVKNFSGVYLIIREDDTKFRGLQMQRKQVDRKLYYVVEWYMNDRFYKESFEFIKDAKKRMLEVYEKMEM